MAYTSVHFFSKTLNISTSVNVVLPEPGEHQEEPALLYLLHGYGDDQTTWARQTSVERFASQYNLAVVMPGVQHSFYTDEVYGEKYWTYISEELPQMIQGYFRLSADREHTFVAGQSMGGYGTMRLALTHPERFFAVGCFSGVVNIHDAFERNVGDLKVHRMRIYGGESIPVENDLFELMKRPASDRPAVYVACGDQDFLFNEQQEFVDALRQNGWQVQQRTDEGMNHSWTYWDIVIKDFLAWAIKMKKRTKVKEPVP